MSEPTPAATARFFTSRRPVRNDDAYRYGGRGAMDVARRMWRLYEPVHLVTYFAPEALAAYREVGLRGYWRGYFAGRAAPLGPVGAGPVHALFFGFHRAMVARALPEVWSHAEPSAVLASRLDGARQALTALLPDAAADAVAEAATLLRAAAESIDPVGRALGAANADLPWPDDPLGVLWQAATILREHRGDGHVAALLTHGLDGAESLVWRSALDGDRQALQPHRGWSDEEWDAARDRLAARGWLTSDGTAAATGQAARDDVERITDSLAAGPWRRLGDDRTERLAELLGPLAEVTRRIIPQPNPIGLPR